jgi:tRNA dimethylallyltransferase
VRALEVTLGSGRLFSSYGDGLERYPEAGVAMAGLRLERADLDARLAARLEGQLQRGFAEEVASLVSRPGGLSRTARQAIGYSELISYAEGEISLDDAKVFILRRLKSFARRQESWFGRDPRVAWFEAADPNLAELVVTWWASEADRARPAAWETERQ